jgi:hypothetical protein
MNYKAASVFSKESPSTNTPIQCSFCPPTSSGRPQTIWKYHAVNHFSSIPGDFLIQMVIRKAEEKAMGIQEQDTVDYRKRFAIPNSDGLEPKERTAVYKRSRSGTTSTVHSQVSYTHHQAGKMSRLELGNIFDTSAPSIFKGELNFDLNMLPEFEVLMQFKCESKF